MVSLILLVDCPAHVDDVDGRIVCFWLVELIPIL